jgi:hypothetical protein
LQQNSNETEESDWEYQKQDGPRISVFRGISMDFNPQDENP